MDNSKVALKYVQLVWVWHAPQAWCQAPQWPRWQDHWWSRWTSSWSAVPSGQHPALAALTLCPPRGNLTGTELATKQHRVLLLRSDTLANQLANGSAAFIWKLCCCWLKGLRQRQSAGVILAPGEYIKVMVWKRFRHYCHFMRGIHSLPVDSISKEQWGALMFPLLLAWTRHWTNNRINGDFARHEACATSL